MTTSLPGRRSRGDVPERVLLAATRLFAEHGYENTSVQQIVEAAGVTKGALYHYFSGKDELLAGTYARLLDLQSAYLEEYAALPASATERMRLVAASLARTILEHLDSAIVFQRSLHLLSDPSRAAFREQRRDYRRTFERILHEGIEAREFRADLPVDLAGYSFFGAVGYLTVWYSPDGPRTVDEIVEGYTDLFMAALRGFCAGQRMWVTPPSTVRVEPTT